MNKLNKKTNRRKDMNKLNKFVFLMIIYSLLGGQLMFVFAQDTTPETKPAVKKPLKDEIWVGKGYDITGNYADYNSAMERIFEVAADDDGNPIIIAGTETFPIEVLASNKGSDFNEFFGKSLSEYQTKFSNRLGIEASYGIFSGHLKTSFDIDDQSSTSKEFATIMQVVTIRAYKMPFDIEKSMISPKAQVAIDTLDPKILFQRFGTHYIWQADVGGRVDYNFTKNYNSSEKDFNLAVEARIAVEGKVASGSVENETKFKNFQKKIEENGSYKITVRGGKQDVAATMRNDRTAFGEWSNSVKEEPTLCRFNKDSLRPIWLLASTDERKQEIQEAYDEYLKAGGIQDSSGQIAIVRTDQLKRVGENWYATATDKDLGNNRIGVYSPIATPENGYFVVGHIANNNNDPRPGWVADIDSILVKELGEPGKLLAKPISYTQVYNDAGTRGKEDWSIWQANGPVNFVAVGFFARKGHDAPNLNFPSDLFNDIRCVHKSLVEPAAIPTKDSFFFSGESQRGYNLLVYRIKPVEGSDAIDGNFFYPFSPREYSNPLPTNLKLYVLKNPSAKATDK